ncbi:MAG TPA: N4-gp56 family major capsid protein [Rhodanobacteraceae bacterium]|nr:N4-gp56 family major capsid protein [Rhodanobacteraceae bacterium]
MSQTIVGLNHPIAVKRWSAVLFTDMARESYFGSRFMSKSKDARTPIQVLTELDNEAGDTITVTLFGQLKQKPTYGDATLRGKEESLAPFTDKVSIDQVRCGVNAGGRMTRKRTLHDLRAIARSKMGEWWARWSDEATMIYLAGQRGINEDFIEDADYAGFAGNALEAPDAAHVLFGGDATAFDAVSNDDQFNLKLIDRAVTRAKTSGGGSDGKIRMRPMRINGEDRYVCVMHPFQEFDVRTNTSTGQWLDIQKAANGRGTDNPIFTGALGMYNNVVLHSHEVCIRRNDAGADSAQPAAIAKFMGRQAMLMAFGSPGSGLRFDWNEETEDRGNQVVITSGTILGIKKSRFKGADFGSYNLVTYAKDPEA